MTVETFTGSYQQNKRILFPVKWTEFHLVEKRKHAISLAEFFTIFESLLLRRGSVWEIFLLGKAPYHSLLPRYHCKNTWVTSTTFLGCLSCIRVTKECYQIGFLEGSLRSFFTLARLFFQKTYLTIFLEQSSSYCLQYLITFCVHNR